MHLLWDHWDISLLSPSFLKAFRLLLPIRTCVYIPSAQSSVTCNFLTRGIIKVILFCSKTSITALSLLHLDCLSHNVGLVHAASDHTERLCGWESRILKKRRPLRYGQVVKIITNHDCALTLTKSHFLHCNQKLERMLVSTSRHTKARGWSAAL